MPQLPSGRHIGIHVESLEEIAHKIHARLGEAGKNDFLSEIGKITTLEALAPYVDVLYFREAAEDAEENSDRYHQSSNRPAVRIEPYLSGFNLTEIEKLSADWSAADQAAFQAFLAEDRTRVYLQGSLDQVVAFSNKLNKEFVERYVAMLWKAGLHPLQEVAELGIEPRTNPNIDLCDLLAALCRLSASHDARDEHYLAHGPQLDQIAGFRQFVLGQIPALAAPLAGAQSLDDLAGQWRQSGVLDALPEAERAWLWHHAHVVTINTFAMFDDEKLKRAYPKEWEVCQLAYVSREAADILNEAKSIRPSAGN